MTLRNAGDRALYYAPAPWCSALSRVRPGSIAAGGVATLTLSTPEEVLVWLEGQTAREGRVYLIADPRGPERVSPEPSLAVEWMREPRAER